MSHERTPSIRGSRVVAAGLVILLVVLGLVLLRGSRTPDEGSHTTDHPEREAVADQRNRFEHVTGGEEDPNADPAELVHALAGRVIDTERRPVAEAEVDLVYRPAGAVEAHVGTTSVPVRSDANGEFVIPNLRAGHFRVEAHKGEAVSATIEVELSARTAPVTLMLVPGATLIVRVVSALSDQPIAGALVRVAPGNSELGPVDTQREARTDTLGVARITGLNPVGNHGVYAEAAGYGGSSVNALAGGNPERQQWTTVIRLHPGGVVRGRVVDARGQPVVGALLRWYSGPAANDADQASGLFSSEQGVIRLGAARSDRDGQFRLSAGIGPGLLEAAHPSHRPGFGRGVVVAGGELSLDVVVGDGARLAGVVLDATGNAVPGADVIITKRGMSHQQMFMDVYRFRATSDRFGEFAFVGLDRDEMSLAAWDRDGASELVDVDLRSTPEQTGIVLELTRSGRIDGMVEEAGGAAVPFAQVTFFVVTHTVPAPRGVSDDRHVQGLIANPRSQGVVVAGEDGRFAITGLIDGEYQLTARRANAVSVAPIFGEGHADKVRPGATVTLTLPGLGSISGRVVADDGAPVTDATVAAALWQGETSYPPGKALGAVGRFKLAEVPAGRYGVKIAGPTIVDWSSREGFDVVAGRDTDVGTIRITRGAARTGVVVDERGAPVPAAQVVMQLGARADARSFDDVCDERGVFGVPAVPPGTQIRVRAYTRDIASDWLTVAPETRDVKIVLAVGGAGSLAGLLVDHGEPIEHRIVMLTLDAEPGPGSAAVDPNLMKSRGNASSEAGGRFQLKEVASGQYRLWVRRAADEGPEWTMYPEPIVIQPGKEVFVVVQVGSR